MKKSKIRFRVGARSFVPFLIAVFHFVGVTAGMAQMTEKIEGLFYIDGSPVAIEIEAGTIKSITRLEDKKMVPDVYIAPGFIDNQINGYVSVSFTDDGLTVEGIRKATQGLWKTGVTTYLPTLVTSSHERLMKNFAVLVSALEDEEIAKSIPGFHLEGPYISPLDGFRGAHTKEWVRKPDWQEFTELYDAADKKILQVTVAPEIEGAIDFIRKCTEKGILVALGHHNGTADQIKEAVDAGAVICTHLGNGCANMIHRHNNPLWPQLAEDRLMASLIVDGFHLQPEEVQTFWKAKGTERIILTSDITKLAGLPPGSYTWDGKEVVLTPEGMIKLPSQNVLAGASLPVSTGVGNIIKFTRCPLADAVHMATRNPAKLYNLRDRGEIKPGNRADIILFTMEDNRLSIRKTILAGKVVYSAP